MQGRGHLVKRKWTTQHSARKGKENETWIVDRSCSHSQSRHSPRWESSHRQRRRTNRRSRRGSHTPPNTQAVNTSEKPTPFTAKVFTRRTRSSTPAAAAKAART